MIRQTIAIALREYASIFRIPLGWIVIAIFLSLSAVMFTRDAVVPGQPATMRPFFQVWWAVLLFLAPAISMRSLADELRTGTLETLLTAPVNELAVVLGKYAACVGFLLTMLLPSAAFVVLLEALSRPDYGPILAGYLGIVLLGMFYLAVGTLASSLTSSQTLAFLGAFFALIITEVLSTYIAARVDEPLAALLRLLSVNLRMADFAKGLVSSAHVLSFLVVSAWLLGIAAVALQSRRWR